VKQSGCNVMLFGSHWGIAPVNEKPVPPPLLPPGVVVNVIAWADCVIGTALAGVDVVTITAAKSDAAASVFVKRLINGTPFPNCQTEDRTRS
jgi:hypothetical protein